MQSDRTLRKYASYALKLSRKSIHILQLYWCPFTPPFLVTVELLPPPCHTQNQLHVVWWAGGVSIPHPESFEILILSENLPVPSSYFPVSPSYHFMLHSKRNDLLGTGFPFFFLKPNAKFQIWVQAKNHQRALSGKKYWASFYYLYPSPAKYLLRSAIIFLESPHQKLKIELKGVELHWNLLTPYNLIVL